MQSEAPTLLNPHFAAGIKDGFASRIFYEPLAQWDADANLEPVLAAEIPSRANGGLAADGRSVVWRLKKGVTWHDGQPFTADDVVFNWQYAIDPAAATFTAGNYLDLKLEKVDAYTVRVVFSKPTPFWPGQYAQVLLVPRHLFAAYSGAKSRDAPNNNKPVGTGAYTFVDFKPGDLLRAAINPHYHQANRPHFDTLELKGGGDTTSAARTVLQTGEYDYAGGLLVDDEVLKRMEAGGKGRVEFLSGSATTAIYLNYADPGTEVDGERSNPKTHHPLFSDPDVRRAIGLLIDRQSIQSYVFGRQGEATTNFINNPPRYRSPNNKAEFSIDKAKAVLDAAGWKAGADGVRAKDGKKLALLFQGGSLPSRAEVPSHRQAGGTEGRNPDRTQGGCVQRVLLVRRGQSRHVRQVLRRHADPQLGQQQSGPRNPDAVLRVVGSSVEGQQVARAEPGALAKQRIRCAVPRCTGGARSSQARCPFHPDERPGGRRRLRAADLLPQLGASPEPTPGGALVGLAARHGVAAALVPRNLMARRARFTSKSSPHGSRCGRATH